MPDMVNKFAQDLSLKTQAFLIILKTLIEEMNRTSATNAELRATQYLIARIQSESQKGKSGLNLIKKGKLTNIFFSKKAREMYDAYGIHYSVMFLPEKNGDKGSLHLILPDDKETTKMVNSIIENIFPNFQKNVVLDQETFGQMFSMTSCVTYTDLTPQQAEKFKWFAAEHNFKLTEAEKDGRISITITEKAAEEFNVDAFMRKCNILNRSGICSEYSDMEAMQKAVIENEAYEKKMGSHAPEKVYYIDARDPSHFVEIDNGIMTIQTSEGKEMISSANADLDARLHFELKDMDSPQKISYNEFIAKYNKSPLDMKERIEFAKNGYRFTKHDIRSAMIDSITTKVGKFIPKERYFDIVYNNMHRKIDSLAKDENVPKELRKDCKKLLDALEEFKSNRTIGSINKIFLSKEAQSIIPESERKMVIKAMTGTLSHFALVKGILIANAQSECIKRGNADEVAKLFDSISDDLSKINQMITSSDIISASETTETISPETAQLASDLFEKALGDIVEEEKSANQALLDIIEKKIDDNPFISMEQIGELPDVQKMGEISLFAKATLEQTLQDIIVADELDNRIETIGRVIEDVSKKRTYEVEKDSQERNDDFEINDEQTI